MMLSSVCFSRIYTVLLQWKSQRWSPRGRFWPRGRPWRHILMSLALASKVKSLASCPRKLACPRLEDSTIFWIVEILQIAGKKILEGVFYWRTSEKFLWRFFFWRTLEPVSLVLSLGLEHSCPWPPDGLSSEGLSLALASDFFCVLGLGLEPYVLDSTSGKEITKLELQTLFMLLNGTKCCFILVWLQILFIRVRLQKMGKAPFNRIFDKIFKF